MDRCLTLPVLAERTDFVSSLYKNFDSTRSFRLQGIQEVSDSFVVVIAEHECALWMCTSTQSDVS